VKTLANETFLRPFCTESTANFSACELSLGNRSTTSFYGKCFVSSNSMILCMISELCYFETVFNYNQLLTVPTKAGLGQIVMTPLNCFTLKTPTLVQTSCMSLTMHA